MSGRIVKVGGVAVLAGAGYYLYQAGGNPKVAEKQAEYDAARASNKLKSSLPGAQKEASKGVQLGAEEAGAKFDAAAAQAKEAYQRADAKVAGYTADASRKLGETKKEVGDKLMKGVDTFDRTVEKKSAEAKGWLGGWFGGGK